LKGGGGKKKSNHPKRRKKFIKVFTGKKTLGTNFQILSPEITVKGEKMFLDKIFSRRGAAVQGPERKKEGGTLPITYEGEGHSSGGGGGGKIGRHKPY